MKDDKGKVVKALSKVQTARIFTLSFALAALVNTLVFMAWQMLNTGMPVYLDQLGANAFEIGLMATLSTIGAVVCRPFTGALVDRYGRKGFLIAGFVVMALASLSYAVFPIVGVILAIRFVHGFGWGFASTANSTIVADILPKKRFAEGMGYFAMTNSLGLALGPALAMILIEAGYPKAMIYVATGLTIASIAAAMVLFLFSYEQPPLKNDIPLSQTFALSNMFERSALFPSTVIAILSMGFGTVNTFIAVMGGERGIQNLALYFIVYAVANVITRPLVGRWVDKHGFYSMGVISCLFASVSFVLVGIAHSLVVLCIAGALVGFGIGTAMSVFQTMSVAIAPPSSRGAASSTYLLFWNGGMGIGTFIGGLLVGPLGYTGLFLAMSVVSLGGCLLFMSGGKERIRSYHLRQHE